MPKLLTGLMSLMTTALLTLPALAGPCDKLFLDLDKGTLNGIKLTASLAEVKKAFPCPHDASKDKHGDHLYFGENSFYITPGKMISVFSLDETFSGTLSKDVLGKSMFEVDELLGEAAHYARATVDAEMGLAFSYAFYPRPWGTLIVKFSYHQPASVEEVSLSTQTLAELKKQYP